MIRKDAAHQVLGNLSESPRCRNRRWQRERARDRAQIGEAHTDRDRPAGQGVSRLMRSVDAAYATAMARLSTPSSRAPSSPRKVLQRALAMFTALFQQGVGTRQGRSA